MSARLAVVRECYECPSIWPARATHSDNPECQEVEPYRTLPMSAVSGAVNHYRNGRIPKWCPLPKRNTHGIGNAQAPKKGRQQ
jgi:hypothetical protein